MKFVSWLADSDANKMKAFHVKILHVLLILGLVAANVGNGSPLQRKLRKGRISNCSRFKNRNSIKKWKANWNNWDNKAQIVERQILPLYR